MLTEHHTLLPVAQIQQILQQQMHYVVTLKLRAQRVAHRGPDNVRHLAPVRLAATRQHLHKRVTIPTGPHILLHCRDSSLTNRPVKRLRVIDMQSHLADHILTN